MTKQENIKKAGPEPGTMHYDRETRSGHYTPKSSPVRRTTHHQQALQTGLFLKEMAR